MDLVDGRAAGREGVPEQPLRISLLVAALTGLGILAPLAGVASAVAAMQQHGTSLSAPVRLAGSSAFAAQPVRAVAPDDAGTSLYDGTGQDAVAAVVSGGGGLRAEVAFLHHPVDSGVALLAHSGAVVAGLTVAVLVALLVPLVRSTAHREPFAPGNAGRLAAAAGALALASAAASVLPYLAAKRLLELPFITSGVWVADLQPVLWPLPAAAVLLVLALAVHAGARLRQDTEGLI